MRVDGPELGEAGEQQWARLRAQIELAGSFWLGFVFSPSPRSVIVLRERAERLLRTQTQTMFLVQPKSPDELRQILPYLLENPDPVRAGCTWIEAVREDSPGAPEQPWTQAWDELFLRMNERRDALRARLQGGLVFAAPPGIKPRVRDAAPDLWSVRSLVIDFEPIVSMGNAMRESSVVSTRAAERLPAPDPELALAEAGRRTAEGAEVSQALALGQAAEGLLAEGRTEEARKAAAKARDLLRGEGGLAEARALAMLAEAEEAVGDPAAAADHIEQAISLARRLGKDMLPIEWIDAAGRLAHGRKDLAAALAFYGEAEILERQRWARGGDDPETLRDLSVSLDNVGNIRWESGDLVAAGAAYEESLTLRRRLRKLRGDVPEALRDLAVSLIKVGDVRRESGDLTAAAAAYEESLTLCRRLRELRGDIPEALRDLSISLDGVGNLRRESGDIDAAGAAYEESLTLCRQLRALRRDTPETLRDLSVSLERVGDLRWESGDLTAAAAAYEESLTLRRRLRELRGDTPDAVRDLLVSLTRVGKLRGENGDLAAAAYEESLTLCRRLRELRGDIPEALRDLTFLLTLVSDTRHKSGDLAGAAAAQEELQALARPKSAPRAPPKPRKRPSKAQPKTKRRPSP